MEYSYKHVYIFELNNLPIVIDKSDFSVYKGVIIFWSDEDRRVLSFIDSLPKKIRVQLVIMQSRKGNLYLGWENNVPDGYTTGNSFDVGTDNWSVDESVSLKKQKQI